MAFDSRIPVGFVALAIGLGMVVGTGAATYVAQVTVAEPVEAEVVSTDVTTVACSVDETCRHDYLPVVTYRFTDGGEVHESDQVYPAGDHAGSESRARAVADRYAPGDRVTAHVVPGRPGTAYLLTRGPPLAGTVFAVFGALLALAGANGIRQGLLGIDPPDQLGG